MADAGAKRDQSNARAILIQINRWIYAVDRHWFAGLTALLLIWVLLPWLAPVLMKAGLEGPAHAIYFIYSFQCHQLPERSFFLFGDKAMYSLEEINRVWPVGNDPMTLRQFIGTSVMGYKVAWSDRMVSAYGSIPLAALAWRGFGRKLQPLSLLGFVLLALPMAIDGSTHFISDLAGLGLGFRYTNEWLAALTDHALGPAFYAGDALGSFNSWMRLLTGTLFGLAIVGLAFPQLEAAFGQQASQIESKFERAGLRL